MAISTSEIKQAADQTLTEEPVAQQVSSNGLTAFEESANQIKVKTESTTEVDRSISQPYKIDVPVELLERTYQVANFNWTPTTGMTRINFPAVFNTIPTISNVMKRFRYWRATVHVEVKMASTPYHQGSLVVAWLPCAGTMAANVPTVPFLTGLPSATILSASVQDSCSFDIPYLHPQDWYDWQTVAPYSSDHSALFIAPLNILTATSAGITTTCPILVYASMKNVQVTGYISQSGKLVQNSEATAKSNHVDAKSAVSIASKIARKIPIIGDVWSPIADTINSFAGNLSKPVNTSAANPVTGRVTADYNQSSGVTNATELSLYPNALITTAPKMFGMETSHVRVADIAKRPMLFDKVIFGNGTSAWSTVVSPWTDPPTGTYDYLRAVANNFRYWRGSIKFLVHFCMPAFYQFRCTIAINYLPTLLDMGDLTTRIIDIKGNTFQEIVIPYCYTTTWSDGVSKPVTPTLTISQTTPILGSTSVATPIVYVNIFRAAGEDFEVAMPMTAFSLPVEKPKYIAQCHLLTEFSKPFKPLAEGATGSTELRLVMSEKVETVADLLKRVTKIPTGAFTSYPQVMHGQKGIVPSMERFFLFWRGSRIVRSIPTLDTAGNTIQTIVLQTGAPTTYSDGFDLIFPNMVPLMSATSSAVPYYSATPYYPLESFPDLLAASCSAYAPVDAGISNVSNPNLYLACGDDMTLLFIHPFFNNGVPLPSLRESKTS